MFSISHQLYIHRTLYYYGSETSLTADIESIDELFEDGADLKLLCNVLFLDSDVYQEVFNQFNSTADPLKSELLLNSLFWDGFDHFYRLFKFYYFYPTKRSRSAQDGGAALSIAQR